jgi:hypothetical protein
LDRSQSGRTSLHPKARVGAIVPSFFADCNGRPAGRCGKYLADYSLFSPVGNDAMRCGGHPEGCRWRRRISTGDGLRDSLLDEILRCAQDDGITATAEAEAKSKATGPAKAGRYRRKYFLASDASSGTFLAWRQGGGRAAALQRFSRDVGRKEESSA